MSKHIVTGKPSVSDQDRISTTRIPVYKLAQSGKSSFRLSIEMCPKVDECMLIPIKDELTGHRLKLLIVGNTNYEQEKLISYMRKHLEDYKIPRVIEEVSSIPKTYNGKKERNRFISKNCIVNRNGCLTRIVQMFVYMRFYYFNFLCAIILSNKSLLVGEWRFI